MSLRCDLRTAGRTILSSATDGPSGPRCCDSSDRADPGLHFFVMVSAPFPIDLRRLPPPRTPTTQAAQVVSRTEDFFAQVERERSRADRSGAPLCLIVLDMSAAGRRPRSSAAALSLSASRVRSSDVVGSYAPDSIAILLPETGPQGAARLIHDLDRLMGHGAGPSPWRIYVHPDPRQHRAPPRANSRQGQMPSSEQRFRSSDRPSTNGVRSQVNGAQHGLRNGDRNGNGNGNGNGSESSRHGLADDEPAVEPLRPLCYRPHTRGTRVRDIVGAAAGLCLLSPVMIAAAIAVKLSSPGPVIYRQRRCGLGGRNFDFFKFRTMYVGQEHRLAELMRFNEQTGPVFKMTNDPRITPVGRFLRKASIDELPQL